MMILNEIDGSGFWGLQTQWPERDSFSSCYFFIVGTV